MSKSITLRDIEKHLAQSFFLWDLKTQQSQMLLFFRRCDTFKPLERLLQWPYLFLSS